jgi:hypothetical protein
MVPSLEVRRISCFLRPKMEYRARIFMTDTLWLPLLIKISYKKLFFIVAYYSSFPDMKHGTFTAWDAVDEMEGGTCEMVLGGT